MEGCRGGVLASLDHYDWEVDYVERFWLYFYMKRACRNEEDRVLWTKTKSGKFIIKFLYDFLESNS